ELAAAPHLLSRYDVLAGLHVRDTIHALGLDPVRFRLADLKPPQKTWRLNRRGRTLTITPELLVSSTTGLRRPFGDPARAAEHLRRGDHAKLARRIESDAKALHAFTARSTAACAFAGAFSTKCSAWIGRFRASRFFTKFSSARRRR